MCSCDGEPAKKYSHRMVHARKEYICSECRKPIQKGAWYEYVRGLWEGEWLTFHTCTECVSLRSRLIEAGCDCVAHGDLLDTAAEHGLSAYTEEEEETEADRERRERERAEWLAHPVLPLFALA